VYFLTCSGTADRQPENISTRQIRSWQTVPGQQVQLAMGCTGILAISTVLANRYSTVSNGMYNSTVLVNCTRPTGAVTIGDRYQQLYCTGKLYQQVQLPLGIDISNYTDTVLVNCTTQQVQWSLGIDISNYSVLVNCTNRYSYPWD
jgi:hypothetical protein